MRRVRELLRFWLTFERRVGRREYLASGVGLAVLKYLGDVAIVWLGTGRLWLPNDYLSSVAQVTATRLAGAPPLLLPTIALWTLPFLWIGVNMSMRRALDAGRSAWLALLIFVPGVSYAFMALMCVLPTRLPKAAPPIARPHEHRLPDALLAIATGATFGLGMLALTVFALSDYGLSLFLGTPFIVGALTAYLFNRRYPASVRETQEIVLMTLACIGGVALLSAWEGALCLVMALPIGAALGALGAVLGRRIALHDRSPIANALLALVVLPLSAANEAGRPPTPLREVRSSIEIDAPPMTVWRSVISFPPLPEPSELVFRVGVAYPMRATLVGEGVGAVRYCVFSTGPFVEPITRWEPGRRLSFDVRSQPHALREWSPYADIVPPHLDGYFRSRRGEFRLIPLAGGRTRLEGSTWYELKLYPEAYWVLFGDALVARIHRRVLTHIKASVERAGRSVETTADASSLTR